MKILFDSHTHINNDGYSEEERAQLIAAIEDSEVAYVMDVGFDLPSSERAVSDAALLPWCYAAVGVHPHDTKTMTEEIYEKIRRLAGQPKVQAIGEIGLDFYYNHSDAEDQRYWFRRQIRLANELHMPIVIHAREADQETMDILKEEGAFSEERCGWFPPRPGTGIGRKAGAQTTQKASRAGEGGQAEACEAGRAEACDCTRADLGATRTEACDCTRADLDAMRAEACEAAAKTNARKGTEASRAGEGRRAEACDCTIADLGATRGEVCDCTRADLDAMRAEACEAAAKTNARKGTEASRAGEGRRAEACDCTENCCMEKDARVLLHCFSGSREMAEQYVKLGATISIAGPVTYKNNRKTSEVVSAIPIEYLLVETDAPYLTPEPHRGKKNQSPYVAYTARRVALLKGISYEEAARRTLENAKRFYGID